jgi:ABC-type glycerol-3-phosphate transport system substrate-binding protein
MFNKAKKLARRALLKAGGAAAGGLLAMPIGLRTATRSAAAATQVTLSFLGGDFIEQSRLADLADTLGAAMDLRVRKDLVSFDDVPTKALLDFSAGVRTWDLVFVYSSWAGTFASRKALIPIEDFLTTPEARALVDLDDFIPALTKPLMYDGKLQALPYLAAPFMIGYRRDLLSDPIEQKNFKDKYGYELAAPQTYGQLLDVSRFFTRSKGQLLAGQPLGDSFYGIVAGNKTGSFLFHRFEMVEVAFGADLIFNPSTMEPTWNSPQNVSAAKYYVDLSKSMPPGNLNMSGGEAVRLVGQGQALMVIQSLDDMLDILNDPKTSKVIGKIGYALMPTQIPARPHAFVQDSNGIGIYALTQHKAEAFKLVAETVSTRGIKQLLASVSGLVPVRRSVINDPEVRKAHPDLVQALDLVASENPYVTFLPQLKEWNEAQDIAATSLAEAMAGQKSVEDALNDGQTKLVALFKRAGYIK